MFSHIRFLTQPLASIHNLSSVMLMRITSQGDSQISHYGCVILKTYSVSNNTLIKNIFLSQHNKQFNWGLKIYERLKLFLWRVAAGVLPVRANIVNSHEKQMIYAQFAKMKQRQSRTYFFIVTLPHRFDLLVPSLFVIIFGLASTPRRDFIWCFVRTQGTTWTAESGRFGVQSFWTKFGVLGML